MILRQLVARKGHSRNGRIVPLCEHLGICVQEGQEGSARGRAILAVGRSSWRRCSRQQQVEGRRRRTAEGPLQREGGRLLPGGGTAPPGAGDTYLRAPSSARRRSCQRTPVRCVPSLAAVAVDMACKAQNVPCLLHGRSCATPMGSYNDVSARCLSSCLVFLRI